LNTLGVGCQKDSGSKSGHEEKRDTDILFAATILAARKLIDMDPNKPNMAKGFFVDRAIDDAAFILERIDKRWPAERKSGAKSDDLGT
jgi:hypothetical protein